MINPRLLAVTATAFVLAISGCGKKEEAAKPTTGATTTAPSSDATVKIGSASPLTGPQAHIGTDIRNGAQLAVDQLNAKGVEIGGKKVKLELVAEDDQADPKTATLVAQKLVDSKVVAVVGHFNSGASIPASRIYSDAGIPQISPGSTNPKYTQQGFKTTFRVLANDLQQGKVIGEFAVKNLDGKKVAIIDDRTAYGQGLADEVEKAVKASGGEVVAREYTTDKATDFLAILTNIKGKAPAVVVFAGIDPQAGPMVKQMRSLGMDAKFLGGDGMQTPNFIKLAGEDAEGAMASIPGLPKDEMPGGKEFLDQFKSKFNAEVELFAPFGYDAVHVFVDSMKRAGSTDPARFLPEIGKTSIDGVIGPIAFDDKGDIKDGPITIFVVKSGKWEPMETVGGAAGGASTATKPADAPADKQADTTADKPAAATAEKPADTAAEKPTAEASADKPADAQAEKQADTSGDKPADASAEKQADAPSDKPSSAVLDRPADAAQEKQADAPSDQPSSTVAEKPAKTDTPAEADKPAVAGAEPPTDASAAPKAAAAEEAAPDKPSSAMAEKPADAADQRADAAADKPDATSAEADKPAVAGAEGPAEAPASKPDPAAEKPDSATTAEKPAGEGGEKPAGSTGN